jgi:hypothetical protein
LKKAFIEDRRSLIVAGKAIVSAARFKLAIPERVFGLFGVLRCEACFLS